MAEEEIGQAAGSYAKVRLSECIRMKVYISGPMSSLPREYFMWKFNEYEIIIKDEHPDIEVVNPTKFPVCRWPLLYYLLGYRLTLAYDLWRLRSCDAICMLPGWESSKGARLERFKAYQWGIKIMELKFI